MECYSITIKKREFPLHFSLGAIELFDKINSGFDVAKIDEELTSVTKLIDCLYVCAKLGAMNQGKELDVNRDWFVVNVPASGKFLKKLQVTLLLTMNHGMRMETDEDDEDLEVDVVLEELKKKEMKTDSPSE